MLSAIKTTVRVIRVSMIHSFHACCAQLPSICRYIWLSNGSWHALLFALRNIAASEEVTFDYELVTEDPEEPQLQLRCNCGAQRCRGTLFTFREW